MQLQKSLFALLLAFGLPGMAVADQYSGDCLNPRF